MIKPWTPDSCPVQVGMCLHDTLNNVDVIVTRRYFYWDGCKDEKKPLLQLGGTTTLTGEELIDNKFIYYPKWPCTLDEKLCCNEVEEDEPDICKLAQCIFNGLQESKFAVKGVHYNEDGHGDFIWESDIHDKVSDVITELADIFMGAKHDEQ